MVAESNRSQKRATSTGVDDLPPEGSLGDLGLRVREIVAFASHYLAAQLDRIKLTAINIAMFVVLGLIGAIVGLAVVFTAAALLVTGVAGAISALLGGRTWAGDLITAVLILGTLVIGTVVAFKVVAKRSRKGLVAAYDQRKHEQRETLGTDVDEQARRR